tara:strand:+ start:881 stop:1105 length:225 start_codon:yes stop_codon:yes gene_type:complete
MIMKDYKLNMLRQVKPNGEYVMTNKEAFEIVLELANKEAQRGGAWIEKEAAYTHAEAIRIVEAYMDYDENIRED